ncbi:DegQ family serine endoprotease [Halomonas nitroreducens]|uniref:Probable periplasmic serine endoprotease DegP-like n=1 Tax=Halomonas nitroreducens TaxID=447425 RepID=A0A431V646_9GAMM|nr:DegQ family serine endoprotease [Halomonas nitroreducens]RTR05987.1 DegQ family serine endoprotease [Halomonas nitroreducens]
MTRMTRQFSLWMLLTLAVLACQSALARELPDFTGLVKEAAPGVVNISTSRVVERPGSPFGEFGGQDIPEIFRHFFGDRMPVPPGGGGRSEERQSLGSGFIIDADGYIMTNAHVVDAADQILVRLNDRRELEAELVGADEKTDVALLKVDADDLPTLELGDSDRLEVGEWVAAIGSPFGFDHSVTAGIVSAINRTLPRDVYVPFIQTDVAINPGNSGGPLFNLDGEVVGINSQIFTRSGGFMGLSFAIPINVAMDVADQLQADGSVSRGWLGVMIQPVSRELAESFGMDNPRGALIADLDPEGPAAEGGLQAGDIILEVNGQEVERSSTLPRLIGRVAPGDDVELSVLRDGELRTIRLAVGAWPDKPVLAGGNGDNAAPARLGVVVQSLEEGERRKLGLEHGVRVTELAPDGIAASAGIRPGDILVSIGQRTVESPAQLGELVAALPEGSVVPVRLYRDGRSYYVALRLASD